MVIFVHFETVKKTTATPVLLFSKLKRKKLKRLFNNTLQNNTISLPSNSYQVCGSLKRSLSQEQINYTINN